MIARKIPTRKQLRQSLKHYTDQGYKHSAAIALIAERRDLSVEYVTKMVSYVQIGRKRKGVTKHPRPADKIGLCTECGQEKTLARRVLQSICTACVQSRKPNPNYEHTPEEFEALKASARAASKSRQRNANSTKAKRKYVEIMVVEQLGVLNGRNGSWSAYE